MKPYFQDNDICVYNADYKSVLPLLPELSIDLILTDPPYGITSCSWDSTIPTNEMWSLFNRLIKPSSAMIFTASQPYTSVLVSSNPKQFRHEWIYKKLCASNFAQADYAPMKEHEEVLVFGKAKVNYYPIKIERRGSGTERVKYLFSDATRRNSGEFVGKFNNLEAEYNNKADTLRFPSSVVEFNNRATGDRGLHPTQKPLKLFEYFIQTYSLEGQTILDPFLGSGTAIVAAKKLGRKCIGIDIEERYCRIAVDRYKQAIQFELTGTELV